MKRSDLELIGLGTLCFALLIVMGIVASIAEFFDDLVEDNPALEVPVALLFLIGALFIVALVVYLVLRHRAKAREAAEEAKRERILSTPLEKFSDGDTAFEGLSDLEEKYAEDAGVEPPKKKTPEAPPSRGAGRCSRCGTPLEFEGQVFCQHCGARFVPSGQAQGQGATGNAGAAGSAGAAGASRAQTPSGGQSPDSSLNSQDINKVQFS